MPSGSPLIQYAFQRSPYLNDYPDHSSFLSLHEVSLPEDQLISPVDQSSFPEGQLSFPVDQLSFLVDRSFFPED